MMFPTLNVFVFVGVFGIFGSLCSALPTQSADTQRRTVTYLTPDGETIVEEISVIGDTVEIDIPDVTILSSPASGLNTLVFKSEEGLRCYVSPRAAFPIDVEQELQNDVIVADGVTTVEFLDTGIEVDTGILDEVAYSKCRGVPTFWGFVKADTNDEDVADETGHDRDRRCVRFCWTVCVNGRCFQRCSRC